MSNDVIARMQEDIDKRLFTGKYELITVSVSANVWPTVCEVYSVPKNKTVLMIPVRMMNEYDPTSYSLDIRFERVDMADGYTVSAKPIDYEAQDHKRAERLANSLRRLVDGNE